MWNKEDAKLVSVNKDEHIMVLDVPGFTIEINESEIDSHYYVHLNGQGEESVLFGGVIYGLEEEECFVHTDMAAEDIWNFAMEQMVHFLIEEHAKLQLRVHNLAKNLDVAYDIIAEETDA